MSDRVFGLPPYPEAVASLALHCSHEVLKTSVQLSVGSSNWRTWSAKSIDPAWTGEWMVEVLAADGTPLGSLIFFV